MGNQPLVMVGCKSYNTRSSGTSGGFAGVLIEDKLRSLPGHHWVVVGDGQDLDVHREWVYNESNIVASQVVWASGLGRGKYSKSDRPLSKKERVVGGAGKHSTVLIRRG